MNAKSVVVAIIVAWLFTAAQTAVAHRLAIFGAKPDFLLVALAAFSPFLNRGQGAWLGFAFGVLQGASIGANLSQYVFSRTLTGFMAAWFNDVRLQPNFATMAITGAIATVFASLAMMFLAPPPGIGKFVADTILSAVYNGVLVWPLYALLKRILDPVFR